MKKRKNILITVIMLIVLTNFWSFSSYAKSNSKRDIYQGYFMRGNKFISVALYTSGDSGAIGSVSSIDRPAIVGIGVSANVKENLGEIFKKNGSYYVKNGSQNMRLDFFNKMVLISGNSQYSGTYIQVSNQGANMNPQDVWLNIPNTSLNSESMMLYEGTYFLLKLEDYRGDGRIRWSSDAPSVATVNKKGKVKAKKTGKATITAAVDGVKYTCDITVKKPGIELSKLHATMKEGESLQLYALSLGKVKWKSSDNTIATVTKNGKVKAKKAGTVTITATYKKYSKACTIKIKKAAKNVFKKYEGKAYFKANAKYRYGVSFKKTKGMVYIGIWNPSGTSSSYEDFYFKLNKKKEYTIKGMRSGYLYDITLRPKGANRVNLKLECKNSKYKYFDINSITLNYHKKVTSDFSY